MHIQIRIKLFKTRDINLPEMIRSELFGKQEHQKHEQLDIVVVQKSISISTIFRFHNTIDRYSLLYEEDSEAPLKE